MAVATADWPAFPGSLHWHEEDDGGASELSPEYALSLALKGELTVEEAVSLSLPGKKVDELLSVGIRMGLTDEELLLLRLLSSFDRRRGSDPELLQWTTVRGPKVKGTEFFLFMIKASVKSGQISWWKKKKSRFSPERRGYTGAIRIARLGADGIHLEQAGDGGQPGALSYQIDMSYLMLWRPNGVVVFKEGSDVPLTEVALIRRLPSGDGISITSHVDGLGVQLGDILFILPCCSATVAVSFTDQSFTVPTKFTEEPLYGKVGLNFINITIPVENLIKKLYNMYEEDNEQQSKGGQEKSVELICCPEEQEKEKEELMRQKKEQEKEKEELMRQKKEQEKEKRESLQRGRAESRKNRCMRKEVKKMVANANLGAKENEEQVQNKRYEEDIGALFSSPPEYDCENLLKIPAPEELDLMKVVEMELPPECDCENQLPIPSPEELGLMKVLEMELCERENMHMKFFEKAVKSMRNDIVNVGGGNILKNSVTGYPLAA